MGYYTTYTMEHDTPELASEIIEATTPIDNAHLALGYSRNCKWYEHEEDMIELSKQFPDTTFILRGVGEEFPDLWKKRFVNGTCDEVRADISYPDFPLL